MYMTLAMVAGKGGRNTAGLHERQARRILKTCIRWASAQADWHVPQPMHLSGLMSMKRFIPTSFQNNGPGSRTYGTPGPNSQRERDYTIWFTCVSSSNLAAPGSTSWGAAASTRACLSSVY